MFSVRVLAIISVSLGAVGAFILPQPESLAFAMATNAVAMISIGITEICKRLEQRK